jgi:hypothetical protein
MRTYLFITHFTPSAKRSLLRQRLNECYYKSLNSQTWLHWKVLVLGEEEKEEGKFKYVRLCDGTKEEKFAELKQIYNRGDVLEWMRDADYIVKLDDDDLISSRILETASKQDFDCYYDDWHTFYDLTSGQLTQQQRPWIASTCIHKKRHAFAEYKGPGSSSVGNLLYSDHAVAWHDYYSGKKVIRADRHHPVYLRILSPTSITGNSGKAPRTITDINFTDYYRYLKKFGYWPGVKVSGFDDYYDDLQNAWMEFSGHGLRKIPGTGIIYRVRDKVSRLWKKN